MGSLVNLNVAKKTRQGIVVIAVSRDGGFEDAIIVRKMKPRATNVQNSGVAPACGLEACIGIFTAAMHEWLDSLNLLEGKS